MTSPQAHFDAAFDGSGSNVPEFTDGATRGRARVLDWSSGASTALALTVRYPQLVDGWW